MGISFQKQVISYEMRSAVCAIFISGAVGGGDSMTHYAADTWAVVDARERHTSFICGGRRGTDALVARSRPWRAPPSPGPHWGIPQNPPVRHLGRVGDYPALGCAVARRIPRFYYLYKFKHFLKYINFLMYAI